MLSQRESVGEEGLQDLQILAHVEVWHRPLHSAMCI